MPAGGLDCGPGPAKLTGSAEHLVGAGLLTLLFLVGQLAAMAAIDGDGAGGLQ